MGTSPSRSITAILISRFLIDLQEANADSQQQREAGSQDWYCPCITLT